MLETPYVVDGVMVEVDDVDAHYERARAAGATILSELEDNPGVGQRQYRAEDLEGHRWMFAQPT
jgi:PhnB protein